MAIHIDAVFLGGTKIYKITKIYWAFWASFKTQGCRICGTILFRKKLKKKLEKSI